MTTWIATEITPALLRGSLEVERSERGVVPHRLPARALAQCPDPQLAMAESQPSGVRLAFRSRATVIELDTRPTKREYVGAPRRPDGVYEVTVDGQVVGSGSVPEGDVLTVDMVTGTSELRTGRPGTLRFDDLPGHAKDIEIWLPWDETTTLVALRTDAPVEPVAQARPVWLHHGSSISHGSNAASPTTTWPALAARHGDLDLVNLGLAGSALLDPFTARCMRDAQADLVSVKIGINLVNHDLMRRRAFGPAMHGFLDTIRDGHPDTPLVVVSPILCPIHEDTPGPSAPDLGALGDGMIRFVALGDKHDDFGTERLTLRGIRDDLAAIVAARAAHDPHLHYLDGRELYGEADAAAHPLPDGLHPDAATQRLIGERFAGLVLAGGGPFAGRAGGRAPE